MATWPVLMGLRSLLRRLFFRSKRRKVSLRRKQSPGESDKSSLTYATTSERALYRRATRERERLGHLETRQHEISGEGERRRDAGRAWQAQHHRETWELRAELESLERRVAEAFQQQENQRSSAGRKPIPPQWLNPPLPSRSASVADIPKLADYGCHSQYVAALVQWAAHTEAETPARLPSTSATPSSAVVLVPTAPYRSVAVNHDVDWPATRTSEVVAALRQPRRAVYQTISAYLAAVSEWHANLTKAPSVSYNNLARHPSSQPAVYRATETSVSPFGRRKESQPKPKPEPEHKLATHSPTQRLNAGCGGVGERTATAPMTSHYEIIGADRGYGFNAEGIRNSNELRRPYQSKRRNIATNNSLPPTWPEGSAVADHYYSLALGLRHTASSSSFDSFVSVGLATIGHRVSNPLSLRPEKRWEGTQKGGATRLKPTQGSFKPDGPRPKAWVAALERERQRERNPPPASGRARCAGTKEPLSPHMHDELREYDECTKTEAAAQTDLLAVLASTFAPSTTSVNKSSPEEAHARLVSRFSVTTASSIEEDVWQSSCSSVDVAPPSTVQHLPSVGTDGYSST